MKKLSLLKTVCVVFVFCVAMAIASLAQVLTTLHSFDSADGAWPYAGLVQATDGNFYGTTAYGGVNGWGTVFKITPGGTLTMLYSFCSQTNCADGSRPYAGLVQGADGSFYGTTNEGGASGWGTVFKIIPSGTLTTLHSFDVSDGLGPAAGLVQGTDADFYGTTREGGASDNCFAYCGTVFKITPSGTLTTLYNFCAQSGCADGGWPQAPLLQASDGNFYGTTSLGGSGNCSGFYGPGCGTVFKITPTGTLTTLHSFDITDGQTPNGLVQATDGNFYGTTHVGGANGCGTVFKITPSGTLTTLYSFCSQPNGTDGGDPVAALVQGSDGNFYGTTLAGGAYGWDYGSVFKITPSGTLTTLHSFDVTDGGGPQGALLQATDGNFYGTTGGGGAYNGNGTIFRLVSVRPCFSCSLQWK